MRIVRAGLVSWCLVAVACTSTSGSSGDAATDSADVRDVVDVGVAQCAAVGMRAARVDPGAAVVLDFLHPRERSWRFNLSPERPRIVAQMPDEAIQELAPSIRTVLLAPDDDRVTVVWVADLRLSRPVGPGRFAKIQHAVRWPDAR